LKINPQIIDNVASDVYMCDEDVETALILQNLKKEGLPNLWQGVSQQVLLSYFKRPWVYTPPRSSNKGKSCEEYPEQRRQPITGDSLGSSRARI
jgi:hypothetical protein